MEHGIPRTNSNEAVACGHCGALVFNDTKRCPQCKKFPAKLHICKKCKSISADNEDHCWKCGRVFEPGGDYL